MPLCTGLGILGGTLEVQIMCFTLTTYSFHITHHEDQECLNNLSIHFLFSESFIFSSFSLDMFLLYYRNTKKDVDALNVLNDCTYLNLTCTVISQFSLSFYYFQRIHFFLYKTRLPSL